jgi:hypothetical protein
VTDGIGPEIVLFVPGTGSQMEAGYLVGLLLDQACLQNISKEMVIAIPLPPVIERNQEQVGPFEIFQGRGGAVFFSLAQHSIAKRAAQTVEEAGVQQESLNVFRLLPQHLFNQIVHYEAVAAGERFDEVGGVWMSRHGPLHGQRLLHGQRPLHSQGPLHCKGGQLQPGNPAFGAAFQGSDIFGREVEAHNLVEKIGRFGEGETQIGRSQFGQLAADT